MASLPYGFPVIFVCLNAQRWLLSLLLVGMLIGFVTNAAAQSEPPTTLNLGTDEGSGINLLLRFPVEADGKTYYFLDRNGDGDADPGLVGDGGDSATYSELRLLLTGSNAVDITNTQDGTGTETGIHDGSDDERSVVIGNRTLVLPTIKEFGELQKVSHTAGRPAQTNPTLPARPPGGAPTKWLGNNNAYATSNPSSRGNVDIFSYLLDVPPETFPGTSPESDISALLNAFAVAFQVISAPATAPTAAPTAVTASPITGGALRIEWVAVLERDNGGAAITTYTATATDTTDTSMTFTCTADGTATDGTATNCTITGLTNGTIYRIVVTATNSVDTGPASTAFTIIPGSPAAPTGVILNPGFEKIVVTWIFVPAEDNGGAPVTGYRTRLFNSPLGGRDELARDDACTADGATATTCTITGLTNGNRYRVVVHATNIRGDSIASSGEFATLSGLSFTPASIPDRTFSVDQPDVTINLPPATEGIPPYTYTLTRNRGTPVLPSGLTFDPIARTISGRPSEAFGVNGGVELVYTATDSDTPRDSGTLTFLLTVNDDALLLGNRNGINFNLRYPVTVNGKDYYHNDHNNNNAAERTLGGRTGDDISLSNLRNLLNGGSAIPETQPGGHDGSDDARSVIVAPYTLVLPTIAEMEALRPHRPATWFRGSYHTATASNGNRRFSFESGISRAGDEDIPWPVVFQVIPVAILSMADVSVAETAGTATVKVQLTNTVTNGFSVDVSTSDGTATAGEDYTALSSHTLTFNGTHNEIQTFSITIRDDNMDEGRETLTVSLSNLQNAASTVILSDPTATIAIIENWLFRIKVFLEGAQ